MSLETIRLDDPYLAFAMAKTPARLAIRGSDGEPVIYRKGKLPDKDGKKTCLSVWIRIGKLSDCNKEDAPHPIRRLLMDLSACPLGGA